MTETVQDFDVALAMFTIDLLEGFDYEAQMDYLRTVKKPPKMSPSEFLL